MDRRIRCSLLECHLSLFAAFDRQTRRIRRGSRLHQGAMEATRLAQARHKTGLTSRGRTREAERPLMDRGCIGAGGRSPRGGAPHRANRPRAGTCSTARFPYERLRLRRTAPRRLNRPPGLLSIAPALSSREMPAICADSSAQGTPSRADSTSRAQETPVPPMSGCCRRHGAANERNLRAERGTTGSAP